MKNTLLRSLLTFLVVLPGFACGVSEVGAAETQTSAGLPSAREVFERFAKVTHAAEGIARTKSLHATGSFDMSGTTGEVDIWSAKPSLRNVSMEIGGFGTIVTGFDGKNGWMTNPLMGARLFSGTELLQAGLEAPYDAALKTGELYESMKTLGHETFEGKDCLAVELVAKPLAGMDPEASRQARTSVEYYEVESGLLIGSKSFQEGDLGSGPVTQIFSAYQDFGGQLMAARTVVRQSGVDIELTLRTVEFDTATAANFAPPLEIRNLLEAEAARQ